MNETIRTVVHVMYKKNCYELLKNEKYSDVGNNTILNKKNAI